MASLCDSAGGLASSLCAYIVPASKSRTALLDFRIQSGKPFPCFTIRLREKDSGSSPPIQFVNLRGSRNWAHSPGSDGEILLRLNLLCPRHERRRWLGFSTRESGSFGSCGQWKQHPENRPGHGGLLYGHVTPMILNDFLHQGQTRCGTVFFAIADKRHE